MKNIVRPNRGETIEQFLRRRKCRNCGRKGEWKILTEDEALWD